MNTFFRVEYKDRAFSPLDFDDLEEARKVITDNANGCPDNKYMSEESREYWKEVAKGMKLFEINRTETKTEIV
jgi:hypothetical protein